MSIVFGMVTSANSSFYTYWALKSFFETTTLQRTDKIYLIDNDGVYDDEFDPRVLVIKNETPLKEHYGLNGPPRPDFIVYNTNQCREVQDWFTYFARKLDCPIFGINPPRHVDDVTQEEIEDVASQFKNMIPICEKVTGIKFDIDRFRETLK